MAEAQRFTTRQSIQSKIQEAVNKKKQQTASSSAATQAGSTTTPTVAETPKVTQTAKAMPSITVPDISKILPAAQTTTTTKTSDATKVSTVNVKDLFGNRPQNVLKKAVTPEQNLLGADTKIDTPTDVSSLATMYDNADESVKGIIGDVIKENGIKIFNKIFNVAVQENPVTRKISNLFATTAIDTARTAISTVQGYLNKAGYSDILPNNTPFLGPMTQVYNWALNNSEIGNQIKEQRNSVFKAVFDKLEDRDQRLANRYGYKQAKKTADKWAEQGKGIEDAINEGNWDVVTTRVGETMGQMLPTLIAVMATRNPKVAAPTVFGMVFGDAYQRSLVEVSKDPEFDSLTPEQKDNLATLMASVEAGIESAGDLLELAPFMKGGKSIASMLGIKNALLSAVVHLEGSALVEGGEEVLTEVLQTALKRAYGGSDSVTRKELGQIFSDTFFIMQFAGLLGGYKGGIETHRRNVAEKALTHEAEKFDNFNDFEAAAERGGIEDKELVADAWARAKGLNEEGTIALKTDLESVRQQEEKSTELYEERETVENELEELREKPEENKTQISKLENRLQEIDNQLQQISENIREWEEIYGEQELPAERETQMPSEQAGENLSEQAMGSVDQGDVSIGEWDIAESKKSFDRSMEQIRSGTEYYDTQFAKNYAYATSGRKITGDTKQNQQMIKKVQTLLNRIGMRFTFTKDLPKGTRGLYDSGIVYYKEGNKELTLYGHEVFHAMMDVINNGKLDNAELQAELQDILRQAIEEVKKQFGIDIYKSGEELKEANRYAEEWIANAFGEYLEGREIVGPKTFVQKILDFFNQIIDLFRGNKKTNLDKQLKKAFDKIVSGEVRGRRGIPKFVQAPSASPIESSTEITQQALRNVEGYEESQEENQLQREQQEELGEHYQDILEAGKQSDYENEIYNDAMNVEESEDVIAGRVSTTPQTVRDIFGKNKKKRFKALSILKTEALQPVRDIMTPAKTRIFRISPRIGGRLVQMETQRDIYTHRYRERAKPFVEAISKLDDKAKLEIKKALLDYGALAYEQGEDIEQYKQEEVAKLKEVLNKYGVSEQATNDMFAMLAELGQRYKDAGLSITLSDIYFPRTVTDYEGLQEYIAEKTGIPQEDKATLLKRIESISRDEKLTEEEKEKKIRYLMTSDYHEPGKTSKNAKERKMGLLSEWGEGIYKFYGDPIEALDSYIVTMEDAIQKQLFLGGLQEDAGLREENVSLSEIVNGLVVEGKISNEDLKELKESLSAILNKKPTPKIVKGAKSIIHIGLLANFISAVTQFDDLGVVMLQDRRGFINIVKAFAGKAGIQYSELGLENSYEMFKDQFNATNWFFAKSFFNAIDRLGKTSFINTAWDSLKRQAKKKDGKDTIARKNLIKRLTDMYGEETANHIMEKIDSNDYMTNGQIDIDVLTDLLYLLSETQPLYTSDMPTAYLNNGWVRLCYSLQSFTIKRMNMLIQGFKQVYENNGGGAVAFGKASVWLMYTTAFLALWGAMIGDAQDFLKGDKEETALYQFLTKGIDAMLAQLWKDGKGSWLKIWNLSDYDKKIYDRQGAWGWLMSKFEPPILGMGNDLLEAITEHNKDEITDLAKYAPILGKLLYYWFWDELSTKSEESMWDFGTDEERDFGTEEEWEWEDDEEWDFS